MRRVSGYDTGFDDSACINPTLANRGSLDDVLRALGFPVQRLEHPVAER